jgi:hypothetical protein
MTVVLHVLEHLMRQDQVEAAAREGEMLGAGPRHAQAARPGLLRALCVKLDAAGSLCLRCQPLQIQPEAAAIIKHAPAHALAGGGKDHLQAAILSGTPDIGWLAAQGSAI